MSSARQPAASERVLVSIGGVLLLAEAWYAFRTTYALVRWDVVFFHRSPLSTDTLTEGIRGLLFLAAAALCLMRSADVLEKGLIPAVLLIPYGIWIAHSYGRSMTAVSGAFQGDDLALGFLSGMGLILIGVLVLIACLLHEQRRRSRLRAFKT